MKQISYGKQRETKNSTPEIEIMTNALLEPPMHPRKQMKCFADMSKGRLPPDILRRVAVEESTPSFF
jgi:hypothetical protein